MMKRWTLSFVTATLLAGCGGHDVPVDSTPTPTPDPLDNYRKQAVSWQTCNAQQLGDYAKTAPAALGKSLQCAQIAVPTDYANPSGNQLKLSLMRVSAPDTANRQGAILINPGGPGADGLQQGVSLALILRDVNPGNATYAGLYQMGQRFDLVGFSPRGTDSATQLTCTRAAPEKFVTFLGDDRSTANIDNALYNSQLDAEACKANSLTPYINTDATARDMDIIRSVLGEDKLNFLGYSYGTALGTWYARLFPGNVGRMMLDGSLDIERPLPLAAADQAPAAQIVLDQLIAPYAATLSSSIDVGATADEVRAILPNAPSWAKQYAANSLYNVLSARTEAAQAVIVLAAVRGVTAIMAATPGLDGLELRARISDYRFATSDSVNALVADAAVGASLLLDSYNTKSTTETPGVPDNTLDPSAAVNMAVACNDAPVSQNPQDWVNLSSELLATAPLYGGSAGLSSCMYWGAPSVQRPPLAGAQAAPPMLMIQGQYDPKTPLAGAERTLGYLPTASMIMVRNENTHAIFPSQMACVDAPVGNYFAFGTQPPRYSECTAPALGSSVTTAAEQKKSVTPPFLHPDATQQLIDERRRTLQH